MSLTITQGIQSNLDYLHSLEPTESVSVDISMPSVAQELSTEHNINLGPYVTFRIFDANNEYDIVTTEAFASTANSIQTNSGNVLPSFLTKWFNFLGQTNNNRKFKITTWFMDTSVNGAIKLEGAITIPKEQYNANLANLVTQLEGIANVQSVVIMNVIDEQMISLSQTLPSSNTIRVAVTMTSDYATAKKNNIPEFASYLGAESWDNPEKFSHVVEGIESFITNRKTIFPQV